MIFAPYPAPDGRLVVEINRPWPAIEATVTNFIVSQREARVRIDIQQVDGVYRLLIPAHETSAVLMACMQFQTPKGSAPEEI